MLNSLRGRLFLSYLAIIATVMFLLTAALLAISAGQSARLLPDLRQLGAIVQGTRRELFQLQERGANVDTLRGVLTEAAEEQNVRLLLVNASNRRVVFDSEASGANWTGIRLGGVDRLTGDFANLSPNLPVGRFQAPDGSAWLVFGQPLSGLDQARLWLVVGRPEPKVFPFFREVFFRPLCFAGLVAFLLSIVLAIVISRTVTRPLRNVASASEAMAQGKYEQRVLVDGPDEVSRVARSFNEMAAKVASTQQSQRDFVANVSHDLKTPITSILGWSQSLVDGTASDADQQRQAALIIRDESLRLERMVIQLLDLARLESGQMNLRLEPVDLRRLLQSLQQDFEHRSAKSGIELTLNVESGPQVMADRDRLNQILTNLLDNAFDHTQPGGQIRLGLHSVGESSVELVVQDTGEGIPAEELERIFERFYQVDKSRSDRGPGRGTGLGLSIVKDLVEAHHGQITAQSQVGMGSTFIIQLPAIAGDSGDA